MKTFEQRTRKQRRRFVLYPSLSLQACTPRQHNALFSHQFQLNVNERGFSPLFPLFFSLACVVQANINSRLQMVKNSRHCHSRHSPGRLSTQLNVSQGTRPSYPSPQELSFSPGSLTGDTGDGFRAWRHLLLGPQLVGPEGPGLWHLAISIPLLCLLLLDR